MVTVTAFVSTVLLLVLAASPASASSSYAVNDVFGNKYDVYGSSVTARDTHWQAVDIKYGSATQSANGAASRAGSMTFEAYVPGLVSAANGDVNASVRASSANGNTEYMMYSYAGTHYGVKFRRKISGSWSAWGHSCYQTHGDRVLNGHDGKTHLSWGANNTSTVRFAISASCMAYSSPTVYVLDFGIEHELYAGTVGDSVEFKRNLTA